MAVGQRTGAGQDVTGSAVTLKGTRDALRQCFRGVLAIVVVAVGFRAVFVTPKGDCAPFCGGDLVEVAALAPNAEIITTNPNGLKGLTAR